jgi:hypothetical protein
MSPASTRTASPVPSESGRPTVFPKRSSTRDDDIEEPRPLPASIDPPYSHGFFDKDPASTAARKAYIKGASISLFTLVHYSLYYVSDHLLRNPDVRDGMGYHCE